MKKYLFLSIALCTTLLANAAIIGPDAESGAITNDSVTCGTKIYATPSTGYHFVKWINSKDSTTLSTTAEWEINFDSISEHIDNDAFDFTAIFEANKTRIKIQLAFFNGQDTIDVDKTDYSTYFSVSQPWTLTDSLGQTGSKPDNKEFETGETATITINGLRGCYVVKGWNPEGENGVITKTAGSIYSYTIKDEDAKAENDDNEVTLKLVLELKKFKITIRPDNKNNGSVNFTEPVSDSQE